MQSLWSFFNSPKEEIITVNDNKEPENEQNIEENLDPISQIFSTINDIYKLIAEDKYEMAMLNYKKYLILKYEIEKNELKEPTSHTEELNLAQQMYEKAEEKFSTVIKSKIVQSIEKNQYEDQIRFCCIYSLLGHKQESIQLIFNHYIKPNLLKITNKLKLDLGKGEKNETIYSGGLISLFEHIAEVLEGLKDDVLLNFGLDSFYYIIDNTQKESDQICEDILHKFLDDKVRKQAEEIIKNKDLKFDVLEIKNTIDEITSMSLKCEIYCNFLLNNVEDCFKLAKQNKIELLSQYSSDYLLTLGTNISEQNMNNSGVNLNSSFNNSFNGSFNNSLHNNNEEFLSEKMTRLELEKKPDFQNYSKEQVLSLSSSKEKISRDISNSKLKRSIQEAMYYYFQLEKFYMEKMIKNSLKPSKSENQHFSFIDIDGFFFVLSSCCRRAISASNCNIASSVITLVESHLNYDLMESITKLSEGEEYSEEEICEVVNDICTCSENIVKLKCILEQESKKFFSKNPKDIEKINSCLVGFSKISKKLKSIVEEHFNKFGFVELNETKQLLEAFDQLTYVFSEEQYQYLQVNDRYMGKLINSVKKQISFFSQLLSESNFEDLKQLIFKYVITSLENSIFSIRFNHLGAVQLEKEIKRLQQSFHSFSNKSVRVLFTKLIQMCSNILTIENPNDILDLWSNGQGWVLNKAEVRKLLALRIESQFHPQAIANIKL